MYHTPRLRGLVKRVLPARFNEVVGVQHIKVYACDDNLMLSG
jgi:CDP-diacylglycerol--glycerol-3-phosphate 3-phosphatidyltransferase